MLHTRKKMLAICIFVTPLSGIFHRIRFIKPFWLLSLHPSQCRRTMMPDAITHQPSKDAGVWSAAVESSSSSAFDLLDESLLSEVISHVGHNHYIFIASLHRRFQDTYLRTFRNNRTSLLNISTLECARFCLEWNLDNLANQEGLCRSAAKHGIIEALEFTTCCQLSLDSKGMYNRSKKWSIARCTMVAITRK